MLNDLLVIRCNLDLPAKRLNGLRENFEAQKESGVILLPNYCDAILVPKDTAIGWLNKDGYPTIDAREIEKEES